MSMGDYTDIINLPGEALLQQIGTSNLFIFVKLSRTY